MSKLFQLKRWLTVPEAAKRLSTIFGEDVSEVDIYRLALDNRLTLSVAFVESPWASICKPIKDADVEYNEVPTLSGERTIKLPLGGQITYAPDGRMLQVQREIFYLENDEPYDLTMMGGERADMERKYWQLAGGAVIDTTNLDGVFLSEGTGGNKRFFQLKGELPARKGDPASFYPLGRLSEDAVIVVTPRALLALEKSIGEQATNEEKPLSTTERITLLKLVIGMAVRGYGHDPAALKSTAPKEIADDLAGLGITVSDDTVRKYLKQAVDAVLPAKPRQP